MVFYTVYLLIVLVSFPGNDNDVTLLGKGIGGPYSLLAVCNGKCLCSLLLIQACKHVVYNLLRLFIAWIVRGQDNSVASLDSFLSHDRSLALIPVSSCTYNRYDVPSSPQNLIDSAEYILYCIRCVCIIHDRRNSIA